jgi:ABC-type uncharacterized transport system involved in gliding motility auxiliary subunit
VKRLVGLLGWLGVVLVLAAVVLRFTRAESPQLYRMLAWSGLVVIGLYALSQWRDIARTFQGRQVRYGSLTAGSVALFLAILVFINVIGRTRNFRWDVTEAQQFTLAEQTQQIVRSLDQPLTIRAFHDGGVNTGVSEQTLRDRLDEYEQLNSQLSVEYIDALRDPLKATSAEITAVPTLLIQYGGRTERTNATDEQTLTNSLKKVIEGQAKKMYFVQGHGEHDTSASDARGYAAVTRSLGDDNFEVDKVTLAQTGAVPGDATVLVIAGPKTDYFAPEVDAIRTYLAGGGKLLMLLDPPETATAPALTNLVALAREWGIDVGSNLVVDESGIGKIFGGGAETPVAMPVSHPITTPMGRVITAHPLARSVQPVDGGVDGRFAQRLVETSQLSWAESDLAGLYATGKPARNLDQGDLNGPVGIAAAISAAAPNAPAPPAAEDGATPPATPSAETRVVVVGDSDFATDSAIGISGNGDLFLNAANWLAQQENLIAIRPKSPEDRRITLSADQSWFINILAIFGFPGLLFAMAVGVWWRRR